MKLSKENIVNSLILKKEHCGIVPTFSESFIEKSVEKQNQMENQIISLKMILGNQQKLIEKFMTEITAIKQKQDKLLEEFQKSKQEEINQAKNSKKEMMTEIEAIKQKQDKLLEELNQEDASDLKEEDIKTIMQQSNVSRRTAIKALREANGDVINAVLNLALQCSH